MKQVDRLFEIAQQLASNDPVFFRVKGPGVGNRSTNLFMQSLRAQVQEEFGPRLAERKLSGDSELRVDFYLEKEATIVEVALGLKKPNSEFEKDIMKALMAKDEGHAVKRIVFISKPGGEKKCNQPGRRDIIQWVEAKHQITVQVRDLA